MASGLALAPAGAGAQGATALACLPPTPETAALCAALQAQIAAARPGLALTLVAVEALEAHPDALRLHVARLRDDGIAARLDWRRDGQDWQRGPDMALNVLDTRLSQPMIDQLLRSLWTQSPAAL